MTWLRLFIGPIFGFLKALIVPLMAWRGGRKAAEADMSEKNLERVDKAARAARSVEFDPDHAERLRDRFRRRGD